MEQQSSWSRSFRRPGVLEDNGLRRFYEGFLGLELAGALEIGETESGRKTHTLHTFYRLGDGSFLAFFEAPDRPFDFKDQHDFDLHIALEVSPEHLKAMFAKGKAAGLMMRGVSDGFISSIYFRDPTAKSLCSPPSVRTTMPSWTRKGTRRARSMDVWEQSRSGAADLI